MSENLDEIQQDSGQETDQDSFNNNNNHSNNNNRPDQIKDDPELEATAGLAGEAKTSKSLFRTITSHDAENFKSYYNFTKWLNRPVEGHALGVFRMLFGLLMMIDIAEERGGSQIDVRYGDPHTCHFPLIHGMRAASYPIIGLIFLCMWIGALGIALGYKFRFSCCAFIIPYWYIFLLNKPSWNNHSYLFGLVGTMLFFTKANHYCSLDKYFNPHLSLKIPFWNYFLVKFQFFLLYMYAGMKKLTIEWLSGYAMSRLANHWIFTPFRTVLSNEMIDLLIIHWFTAIFDFSIPFLMTIQRTRLYATPFMICFHLFNSRLFLIGMFPWVCLAEVPLFFCFDWPAKLKRKFKLNLNLNLNLRRVSPPENMRKKLKRMHSSLPLSSQDNSTNRIPSSCEQSNHNLYNVPVTKVGYLRTAIILFYCFLQLFLPYSHFITKGYNNWTEGLYGYSWDMMVHSYDTVLVSIAVVDNNNKKRHSLEPYAFTEHDRWTKYADMAKQYAQCIHDNLVADFNKNPSGGPLSTNNISIYFDIWCSMNSRFQQRTFDPRIDLLKAKWSIFESTSWSLPLLDELNHLRPKIKIIADEILAWNNASDVIFVADFPSLSLETHIAKELVNASLTILEGHVRYTSTDDMEPYFLTAGKSIALRNGEDHEIKTIGSKPSCFYYSYVNQTILDMEMNTSADSKKNSSPIPIKRSKLPLREEFISRLRNYKRFLINIGNCLLFLIYGVPIPLKMRDIR